MFSGTVTFNPVLIINTGLNVTVPENMDWEFLRQMLQAGEIESSCECDSLIYRTGEIETTGSFGSWIPRRSPSCGANMKATVTGRWRTRNSAEHYGERYIIFSRNDFSPVGWIRKRRYQQAKYTYHLIPRMHIVESLRSNLMRCYSPVD